MLLLHTGVVVLQSSVCTGIRTPQRTIASLNATDGLNRLYLSNITSRIINAIHLWVETFRFGGRLSAGMIISNLRTSTP
jgi:hypothetical protein